MTIRFNLKRAGAARTALVAIVRHNGRQYSIGTGISIQVVFWDATRQRHRTDADINEALEAMRKKIRRFVLDNDRPPTRAELF